MSERDPDTYLSPAEQREVQRIVGASTLNAVARDFKVAPQTLARAAAGMRVHRGSLKMVREGIEGARATGAAK